MNTPGVRSLARAMTFWSRMQTSTSHNLANVATDGYRGHFLTSVNLDARQLPEAVEKVDTRQGAIRETGMPLDLAIDGDGFLVLQTPTGDQWSRGGSLRRSPEGFLETREGYLVLGANGPIPIGDGPVTITTEGWVLAGDVRVDRIRVEAPIDPTAMLRAGGGRWVAGDTPSVAATGRVLQGAIEGSNVEAVDAMVEMIRTQRSYEGSVNALRTLDESASTAIRLARLT